MAFLLQILTQPAILVGLVAMIGLLLQRRSLTQTVLGTLKTILGFLTLNAGISITTSSLSVFDKLFRSAFNVTGVYLDDNIAVGAMMNKVGEEVGLIMVFAFVVNILIARFTPAKWIYLTGHKIWHMAGGLAFAMFMLGVSGWQMVVIGALALGTYMAVQPAILQPLTRKVTNNNDFGVGHTMSSVIGFSALIGKAVGNPKESIEEIKLPSRFEFFRDMSVAFTIIMLLMFSIPAALAQPQVVSDLAKTQHVAVFVLLQSLTATAGILIVLQGVRMFIGELIPAFKGIALKLVKGARPALDVPVVFPFAPTGVTVGLITCFVGWILGMFVCKALGFSVIAVPSMIGVMFGGTTAAVYGNALGGKRGSVVAGLLSGLVWPLAAGLFYPVLDLAAHNIVGTALLTPDIYLVVAIVKGLVGLFR